MTRKIYTIGYTGKKIEEIKKIVDDLGAVLVDVRFSARSRAPMWNKGNLEKVFGQKYMHLPEWGNANYKSGGDIAIVNFERGRLTIDKLAAPVVLMCACKDVETCHRCTLGDMLYNKGYTVTDL